MRKRCYYQVLEVNLKATLGQIRHSFHKLAMKWHPDKNKSEEAKIKFQEINEAYSILSDPSEKTWYDRHRETIIKNWNANNPDPATATEGNVLMNTSATQYWPYFMRPAYLGYDDTESGFYTVYRQVFRALKNGVEEMNELVNELEETEQEDYETNKLIVRAPSFGDSETRLGKVAQFYYYWENMIPFIEASWENLHHLESIKNSNIPIEELKWREKLVKKFIEMVKNLVYFVKGKDPRYALYLENKALIDAEEEEEEIQAHEEIDKEAVSIECDNPSQEIQLYDDNARLEREACLECWNWANMHLATLVQLDPKDVDWAAILFGAMKKIANTKDDVQYPAIEDGQCTPKNKEKKQSKEKMIIEDEGQIQHNEDQEL